MKTKSFIIGWALVVLLAGACFVQAGTIRSYDFNHLSDGTILGQDSPAWTKPLAHGNFTVGDVVGADGNTSKAIYRTEDPGGTTATVTNLRDWPTPVNFTSADTAVWQSFQFKLNSSTGYQGLVGGARFSGAEDLRSPYFGMDHSSVDKWYMRIRCDGSSHHIYGGSDIVDDHWYEVKLVMDFSTAGGLGTLYHRDLTLSAGWVQDTVLSNVALCITPTAGQYEVTGLSFSSGDQRANPPAGWIDNYVLDDPKVPEPGTLVLLATGLIGLLCYAWRKQK